VNSITSDFIKLEAAKIPVLKVEINRDSNVDSNRDSKRMVIRVDLLEPDFFSVPDDKTGSLDKLRTATEFAQKLTDSGIKSLLRKGKEAITLGERARPSLSRIITKRDDLQINSIKESAKLEMILTMPRAELSNNYEDCYTEYKFESVAKIRV
jgi:hypothetical protein